LSDRSAHGVCQLTNASGRFVKAHIIPKSLTRPEKPDFPLVESTDGQGLKRRWDSWYDRTLVIRKGEDILRDIDTAAIAEMRRTKLIWSGFDDSKLNEVDRIEGLETHGFRKVADLKASALWLFAASICWRASRSSIPSMAWFKLEEETEEKLKSAILARAPEYRTFPTSLTQLATKGKKHNQTPTIDGKEIPNLNGGESKVVPVARIYVDGLVFHLHLGVVEDEEYDGNSLFLGAAEEALVVCIDYEVSHQKDRLNQHMAGSFKQR